MADLVKDCRNYRRLIKERQSAQLHNPVPDILGTLPEQNVCLRLVESYLRTFEPLYRIVHIPSFWKSYDQFWVQPQAAPTVFVMKLVLILAIGTTFHATQSEYEYMRRLARTWIYSAQWWLTGTSEKSTFTLDGLQVFCLLVLSREARSMGVSPSFSAEALLRMAMSLGLHRDPDAFPSLSKFQSEIRRRLWATVIEFAVQSSLQSGMPLLISTHDFDTKLPSNINDADIDSGTTLRPEPKDICRCTDTSIQLLLHKSLALRMKVAHQVNSIDRSPCFGTALEFGRELQVTSRDVSVYFLSHSSPGSEQHDRINDFQRRLMDIHLHRLIVLLHRPFVVRAGKNPRFFYSRKISLESCMTIASYTESLKLPSEDIDDFSRLTMYGGGTFRGALNLEIITMLGIEVITQLEEMRTTTSSLASMANATRDPVIKALEHIRDQLEQITALGNPTIKRTAIISMMIGQIKAMESGQSVKLAAIESLQQSLKKCFALLHDSGLASTPQDTVESLTTKVHASSNSHNAFEFDDNMLVSARRMYGASKEKDD